MTKNIFSALSKYNSAIDENYLTEAFVFVIKSLLENDRKICLDALKLLCVNDNEYQFSENENITISTQESTEQGRPDIRISTPDKLIYVEVKHNSGLGYKQIERYKTVLKLSDAKVKKVILLTRFSIDFINQNERPYKHVRWFDIYNFFSNAHVENPINEYLIKSFLLFLEEKNMSIQKISWEYIKGVPALKQLINMIDVGIHSASLKIHQKSAAWEWIGFYIQSKEYFCGIFYENPLKIKFKSYKDDETFTSFSLDLESIHFFSLNKDKQLEEISKFIKQSYDNARKEFKSNKEIKSSKATNKGSKASGRLV